MHICNACYQVFTTDADFKKHGESHCFQLHLPVMQFSFKSSIPPNILQILLKSMDISVIGLKCTYPSWTTEPEPEHKAPPPSPVSGAGFANFREKYKNELYSEDHNEEGDKNIEEFERNLQIEEVSDDESSGKPNKKKRSKLY